MSTVECEVEYIDLENDQGFDVLSVVTAPLVTVNQNSQLKDV